jgi:PemK-like, MazF-like toxin of type II toxin-antitoxin system
MPPVALAYIQIGILPALQQILGIAVFVGLCWLASLLYKSGRRSRPSIHARPLDDSWLQRPTPGEIWWADVPFAEGTGAKIRPCLVVRTHTDSVDVLKITSQDKRTRVTVGAMCRSRQPIGIRAPRKTVGSTSHERTP